MNGNEDRTKQPAEAKVPFPALRNPGYRVYFFASALAMMADNVEHVISYWVLYQKFHSQALGGFAVISHWLPFLFFSVYSGALADRFDPRRLIQLGCVGFIIASVGWGYFFVTDTLEMWHAMVLLVIHGCSGVLWGPAGQLLVQYIVGRQDLSSAVRLNATARTLGICVGPAMGSAIMLAVGPTWGMFVNVVFYLPLLVWLWKAPYGPRFSGEKAASRQAVRGFTEIWATMRDIAGNRTIVSMILLAGAASLVVGNAYQSQMPEFAEHLGHGDAGVAYSMLLAADALGAITAGFVLESLGLLQPRPRTAFILAMLWCCAIAGFAASPTYPVALTLLFIAGFLQLSFASMAQALVQLHSPQNIRGRVIGLYAMSAQGLRAFSGVTVGVVGAFIGIHSSLALAAMMLLALIAVLAAFATRIGYK